MPFCGCLKTIRTGYETWTSPIYCLFNQTFVEGRRNYLTYSVLGGLLSNGKVEWDQETKFFTKANIAETEQEIAQDGLRQIEDAILQLLEQNPQGLRNFEIAELLGLIFRFSWRAKELPDLFGAWWTSFHWTDCVESRN